MSHDQTASVAAGAAPSAPRANLAPRLESVDALRGLVMVLMVLDHVREFFGDFSRDPTDLATTTLPLFLTRWITHFCAPVFVFLAGTGAYLAGARGKSRASLSRYLWTRGLWLVLLELTLVRWGMTFRPDSRHLLAVVLWTIGWSMVVLAALVHLPTRVVGVFGVAMIAGHNLMDRIDADTLGPFAPLWHVLHQPGGIELPGGWDLFVLYPLVPWAGVMAAGYAFGAIVRRPDDERRRALLRMGLGLTAAFVLVRALNRYGDPRPWSLQERPAFTLLSFLNCTKYPPSLAFLLMTLGPAITLLGLIDRGVGAMGRPLVVLGRVPLFYYVLQWPVIHGLALLVAMLRGQPIGWLFNEGGPPQAPPESVFGLPGIYAMGIVTLLILYPACAWFAGLKRRRKDAWLSYL
jgi:uncharacterized membrane protein